MRVWYKGQHTPYQKQKITKLVYHVQTRVSILGSMMISTTIFIPDSFSFSEVYKFRNNYPSFWKGFIIHSWKKGNSYIHRSLKSRNKGIVHLLVLWSIYFLTKNTRIVRTVTHCHIQYKQHWLSQRNFFFTFAVKLETPVVTRDEQNLFSTKSTKAQIQIHTRNIRDYQFLTAFQVMLIWTKKIFNIILILTIKEYLVSYEWAIKCTIS